MSEVARWGALLLALALAGSAARVAAQDALAAAEEAYASVDFERTVELARRALRQGGHAPERLARIHELMAVALAAQGDEQAAREAALRFFALRPDASVDSDLAPRLRSPFLEARGVWAARSDRLSVEARLVRSRRVLRVRVSDPLAMGARLRVLVRSEDSARFTEHVRAPGDAVEIPVPGDGRVDYVVQLLDAHGNRLVELGSEDEPRSVAHPAVVAPPPPPPPPPRRRAPRWVWGVVAGVVGAAALGVGLGFGLRTRPVELRSRVTFQ